MEREMNLLEIFQALKKRITILLLLTLGFAVIGGGASMLLNEKVYTSTASLIVGEEKDRDTDEYNEITGEPIQERVVQYGSASVSKESEKFYNEILDSNDLLEEVINNLDLDTTKEELRDSITMEVPEDSGTILITVDSPKSKNADQIVDEVVEDFQQRVFDLTEIEKIKTMNAGSEPKVTNTVNVPRNILISMVAGFMIGAVVVLVLEYLDDSVESTKEVEKLGLSVIGRIKDEKTHTEDLKNIRTHIEFSENLKDRKSIVVTIPDQETKNISFDLANVLTEANKKVLLIDTNFRNPSIQKELGISNGTGLSEILTNRNSFAETVNNYKDNERYQVLTTGSSLDYPSEKLSSNEMRKLLTDTQKEYDYIIMNGHPINEVTDTTALATLTDGVILVVKPNVTKAKEIRNIQKSLADVNVDILGIVFNEE